MGQAHLRNLVMLRNVEVVFGYDVDPTAAAMLSEQHGIRFSADLESDLKEVDGAVIVTPTSTHADYIRRVSKYVRNIFVEKPLTDSLGSTQEIQQLATDKSLRIQVGFIERYNPAVAALEKTIRNGGRIISIDFARTNKLSSRITDVDVVMDLMIHDIDLALKLNGPVRKVEAHGFVRDGMIEYARATLIHASDAFSDIVASRITEKRIRRICATCDTMYVDCNLLGKTLSVNRQTAEQYLADVSITSTEETIDVRPQEALLLELLDFLKLCEGEPVSVPGVQDATAAMQVADAVRHSIVRLDS